LEKERKLTFVLHHHKPVTNGCKKVTLGIMLGPSQRAYKSQVVENRTKGRPEQDFIPYYLGDG
jgi:hypothetical protein